jgi:hypothetical protein
LIRIRLAPGIRKRDYKVASGKKDVKNGGCAINES